MNPLAERVLMNEYRRKVICRKKSGKVPETTDRLIRLADSLQFSVPQLAEIFGVDYSTARSWYIGQAKMRTEFERTLTRLESERCPALSKKIKLSTVKTFYKARRSA